MDSPIFEPVDITVPAGPVGLEEQNSASQSYPLPSIETKANQEKRGPSASSFTSSENPLSMTDWTSDETALDNPTPASSVYSDPPLSIDPRLLNEFRLAAYYASGIARDGSAFAVKKLAIRDYHSPLSSFKAQEVLR